MKLKSFLINESEIKQFYWEDPIKEYNKIKKDCNKYITLLNGREPFMRSVKEKLFSSNSYYKKRVRKNRRSLVDSFRKYSELIDEMFHQHKVPLRRRSVNATSSVEHARIFFRSGGIYYFLPIGNFNYAWAETRDFNYSSPKWEIKLFRQKLDFILDVEGTIDEKEEKLLKNNAWNLIKDGLHVNNDILTAHTKNYETWFECDWYYLIPIGDELGELFQ